MRNDPGLPRGKMVDITSSVNPEASQQAFSRQLRRFQELYRNEVLVPLGSTLASPKAVLTFAEELMLCPTEDAVIIRLQRDREAARGVYVIAGDVACSLCRACSNFNPVRPKRNTILPARRSSVRARTIGNREARRFLDVTVSAWFIHEQYSLFVNSLQLHCTTEHAGFVLGFRFG